MKKILFGSLIFTSIIFAETVENNIVESSLLKKSLINKPIKAILLNGFDYVSDEKNETFIPLIFEDENACKYIGNAKYSLSTERVFVTLEKKSCFINEQVVETKINGIVMENLMIGIKSKVEYSNKIVAEVLSGRNVELFITEEGISKSINPNEIKVSLK